MINSVGIIGNGFVGNAIYINLNDKVDIKVFDVDPNKSINTLDNVLDSDLMFVCLPTPMSCGGVCDVSFVFDFFKTVQSKGIFILKSTVPIGTTEKLCKMRPDLKIIHNPEFLTAVNASEDFLNSDRTILGGDVLWCEIVKEFFLKYFPNSPIQIVASGESETIKYFSNCFLASKIAFFNNLCYYI